MHRSAQNYEGIALARVAPKVRRDALALDAEEDVAVRRFSTQHGGGDFEDAEDGIFADEMLADIDRHSCPLKTVDTLTNAEWKRMAVHTATHFQVCQGHVRVRTSS